jgi:hypothetical protein
MDTITRELSGKANSILSLLAYSISLFLFYLQLTIPLNITESLPPQALPLLRDLFSNSFALLPVIRFFVIAIVIHLIPTWIILAAYRRDPRINHYTARKLITVGIGYILLWHLLIAVFNAILVPKSNWAVAIYYNTNWFMSLTLIFGSSFVLLFLLLRSIKNSINNRFIMLSILFVSLFVILSFNNQKVQATSQSSRQNIIIIGIDSFSIQQYHTYKEYLPNIRKVMEESVQFSDTITPLGRTFAAWTSILSGKYPRVTGARNNLTPLNIIDSSNFLPKKLQSIGYTTLFAMDERKFSNIDESWGFDKVIGPEVGAADFIISVMSDLPIVNIVVTAWPKLGEKLFPFVTYNRAVVKTYFPQHFSDKLDTELSKTYASPLFLAVHFCIAHTPFIWGDFSNETPQDFTPIGNQRHFNAIKAADMQVGRLLETLRVTGRLNNAIVVLLSDHGEGLGYRSRTFTAESNIPPAGASAYDFNFSGYDFTYGHGSNVNEPEINQVILAINQYIDNRPVMVPSIQETPATLVDIMPTILALSGEKLEPELDLSGISLVPSMLESLNSASTRLRFLETGLSPRALNTANPSHKSLFEEFANLFKVNSIGRVEFIIDDKYKELMKSKTKAVIFDKWQLTVYPPINTTYNLLLFNRETGKWTDNQDSPLWHEANGDQLLDKLINFFGVEEME